MKIAVLFDGAGLARKGLEDAGHDCTGFEIDPVGHYLSKFLCKGRSVLGDVRKLDDAFLCENFDAIWFSPPCQEHSLAKAKGTKSSMFSDKDLLQWSIDIAGFTKNILITWIENVTHCSMIAPTYNSAQFGKSIQSRNRKVGGHYLPPKTEIAYKRSFPELLPAVTATEFKGCATDKRRASRKLGRRLTIEECAEAQQVTIPEEWHNMPEWFTFFTEDYLFKAYSAKNPKLAWKNALYKAIGNGVPCEMAKAFGSVYDESGSAIPGMVDYELAVKWDLI